ncbi:MAG: RidA family protein [Ectothiorhodospiraceae bacterium]|nr:RidA family protein [Ectothiorhodospiraceae bacterium]MCH8505044.1 RidA family protein [Ectothiorhodospiraceae bacterium]
MQQQSITPETASRLTLINPPGLYDPAPNGYSHIAVLPAGARLAHIAGQGGETEDGELKPDFRLQVRQALTNLLAAVAAAGGDAGNIAKLTVLIVDHSEEHLRIFGEELVHALGEGPKPACTLIPVPRLALDGMLFEVEAVALLPNT